MYTKAHDLMPFETLNSDQIKQSLSKELFQFASTGYQIELSEKSESINHAKSIMDDLKPVLSDNEKEQFSSILNNVENRMEHFKNFQLEKHLMNFFAFMEYLCSFDNDMQMFLDPEPSDMLDTEREDFKAGCMFNGTFSKEFESFQDTIGINVLLWANVDDHKQSLFFKNFDRDINTVRNEFLGTDISIDFFDEKLNCYQQLKQNMKLSKIKSKIDYDSLDNKSKNYNKIL